MGQGYPPQRPLRRPHLSCHCAGGLTGWRWWWDGSTCPEDVTVLLQKPLLLPHSLCLQKALQMQPQAAQDGAQSRPCRVHRAGSHVLYSERAKVCAVAATTA